MGRYLIVYIDLINKPGVMEARESSLCAAETIAIREAQIRKWIWFRVIEVKE